MEDGSPNGGPFCLAFYGFRVRVEFRVKVRIVVRVKFRVKVSVRDLWLTTIQECSPYFTRVWHNPCNQCFPCEFHAVLTHVPCSSLK